MKCPCNPSVNYSDCCKKAHQDITTVSSPEALMRSRYAAFVLANINYLQLSHHSSTRPSNKEKKEILRWTKSVEWVRLEILYTFKSCVEFKAYFIENGKSEIIHENSVFTLENNHWTYLKAK